MACLDRFGTIFLILPIGISSISREDTGIAFFRDLITRLAKNYPKPMLVDNANMIRRNRAIPSMIKDADDPHFSERGKKQMVENLMAALRIAQADIASYAFVVNDRFVKVKRDPHRPSPKARFNRCAASYTGVPEATSKRSPSRSSESKPASTASHVSYAAAVTAQDLPVQPSRVRASSLLQLTRQALAAMATSSLVNPTATTSSTVLATGPAAPLLSTGTVQPVSVPQTSVPQASVNSIWQLPPPPPCPPVRNAVPARSEPPTPSLPTATPTTSSNSRPSDVTAPTVPSAPVSSAATVTGSGARPKVRGTPAASGASSTSPMNTAPTVPQGATGPVVPTRSTTDSVTITAELFQQLLDAAAAQRRDQSPH